MKQEKINYYQILNKWLYDRNKYSLLPKELKDCKQLPKTIILYHFQYSKYINIIDKFYNRWNIYNLSIEDILLELKTLIYKTNYKPPFVKYSKKIADKLAKVLKLQYPYLKKYEILLLVDYINNSELKEFYYKQFGLEKDFEKKKNKKTKKERQIKTVKDLILEL